jgi:hypothetical protein
MIFVHDFLYFDFIIPLILSRPRAIDPCYPTKIERFAIRRNLRRAQVRVVACPVIAGRNDVQEIGVNSSAQENNPVRGCISVEKRALLPPLGAGSSLRRAGGGRVFVLPNLQFGSGEYKHL